MKDVSYLNPEHVGDVYTDRKAIFDVYCEGENGEKFIVEMQYDKWLYALKNLYKLTQRPKELCDKVFDRLFEEAEIAKFTPQEIREYEASKMAYRDIKNSIDTAKREGRIEANIETAQRLLAMGLPTEQVAKATQLPLDMVQNLSN